MGMNALPPLDAKDLDHVIGRTRGLWETMRGKKVFITGGTGFFGSWLLESFIAANDQLKLDALAIVLAVDPGAFRAQMPHVAGHRSVTLEAGDKCSCDAKGERFDFVIHAAAEPFLPIPSADPLALYEKNVAGTKHVLELARKCGATRLLFTSSGAVYGRQPSGLTHIPEEYPGAPDPLDPRTTYYQAKRASEFLCACARSQGIDAVVARCFAFVGPHLPLDANFAVGNFIRDALRGGPIQVNGDGTSRRSYLYAADLAIWLWTLLFNGKAGRAYNVGSDADLSILELAQEVRQRLAPKAEIRVALTPAPGKPSERYVPSIARARSELGLDVSVALGEAITRAARWCSHS